jgi:transposase
LRHATACEPVQALAVALDLAGDQPLEFAHHSGRSADALVAFMDALAAKHPGKIVYVVWDNLNTHYDGKDNRWTNFNARHGNRFRFVYTPKHASWMNQVEIWFSILQRRVIRHGSFSSAKAQRERILGFIDHWNRWERHPFRWTWRAKETQNRQRHAA